MSGYLLGNQHAANGPGDHDGVGRGCTVYWRLYESPQHARECLAEFRERYNQQRPHWALVPHDGGDPMVPADVYEDGMVTQLPRWQGWARDVKAKLDDLLEEQGLAR